MRTSGDDSNTRRIHAYFDETGIRVYQAFSPPIVDAALKAGTFSDGFSLTRMTSVKPSFGWMLHRSEYASARRQECVLRITITHEGFRSILGQAVPTLYNPDLYAHEDQWRRALERSEVRYQWDPDRTLHRQKLDRRAIQLGIRGDTVQSYVRDHVVNLEDVTELAREIGRRIHTGAPELPEVPDERPYPVSSALEHRLGMSRVDRHPPQQEVNRRPAEGKGEIS